MTRESWFPSILVISVALAVCLLAQLVSRLPPQPSQEAIAAAQQQAGDLSRERYKLENAILPQYKTNREFVRAVYRKMLHRDPAVDDPKGLANYVEQLDGGATRAYILWNIAASAEAAPGYRVERNP